MDPAIVQGFCDAQTREINRLWKNASSGIAAEQAELTKVGRQIAQIIPAIQDGMHQPFRKVRMDGLQRDVCPHR
jgi:hypothetical protein